MNIVSSIDQKLLDRAYGYARSRSKNTLQADHLYDSLIDRLLKYPHDPSRSSLDSWFLFHAYHAQLDVQRIWQGKRSFARHAVDRKTAGCVPASLPINWNGFREIDIIDWINVRFSEPYRSAITMMFHGWTQDDVGRMSQHPCPAAISKWRKKLPRQLALDFLSR